MATLTDNQIYLVGAIGGLTAIATAVVATLLAVGVHAAATRAIAAITARNERSRTLHEARQRLTTFSTIEDLKD
ncbi:hypothetical protein ABZT17_26855 [Streptomyces sp. NPDC005648]|uniref:hypothetical protein n=1 Tax=Streptomyces sp. NPDC005648 TaxID=3157044 RepID=UPI0033B74357